GLSVALSGIASLLLPGGRTSYSRFRISIDLDKDSCCAIDVTSDLAELIKDHVRGGHNKVFGGKVVVLGGDFRQILPVISNGTRFDIVTSVVNKSDIMPPRMRTRSAGRPAAESLGGGTSVRVGRGGRGIRPREANDERVDDLNGQGNDQGMGANKGVEGVNGIIKGANGGAPDFSMIIAQQ
ncbi:reverse transcriptase domain-containing protein, partial [Tanacetum coccineum]